MSLNIDGILLLQQIINGISKGSVYALIALGYTMVYGIIELINFAHGDVFMLGPSRRSASSACSGSTTTTGAEGSGQRRRSCWLVTLPGHDGC